MANTKSATKRAKQAERRRQHNVALRSRMRTAIKRAGKAIEVGEAGSATKAYREGTAAVDSMATKGLIHPNKAARHKSRLNKALKGLSPEAQAASAQAASAKSASAKAAQAKAPATKKKVAAKKAVKDPAKNPAKKKTASKSASSK